MAFTDSFTADADSANEFVATGTIRVHMVGTFGGGSLVLEEKQPDDTFDALTDTAKTADADQLVHLGTEVSTLRFSLSGSTTPAISVVVKGAIISPA